MIVPEHPARVVKLGGSLLTLPDLSYRLREWIAVQTPKTNIIIVGGGRVVDEVQHAVGDGGGGGEEGAFL